MYYVPRRKFYEDVVALPATATTSSAVFESDELYAFEGSNPGNLTVFVEGDTAEISVADPLVNILVSYDEGATWVTAETITVDNATFTYTVSEVSDFAPRVKVQVDLNGATLGDPHLISVDVLMEERYENLRQTVYADVVAVPDTVADGVTTEGTVYDISDLYVKDATAVLTITDAADLTDVTVQMQSSWDGTNWWDLLASPTDISANTFTEVDADAGSIFGNYIKVQVITAATTGDIATGNDLTANLALFHA